MHEKGKVRQPACDRRLQRQPVRGKRRPNAFVVQLLQQVENSRVGQRFAEARDEDVLHPVRASGNSSDHTTSLMCPADMADDEDPVVSGHMRHRRLH